MKWNPPTQLPEDGERCLIVLKIRQKDSTEESYIVTASFLKTELYSGGGWFSDDQDQPYHPNISDISGWIAEKDVIENFKNNKEFI